MSDLNHKPINICHRCTRCEKYLSYFPIYVELYSGDAVCGRCKPLEGAFHNSIYESSVENLKFPCCYRDAGCAEYFFPKDIPQHERLCSFRNVNCPILASLECDWEGLPSEILQHVQVNHPEFILGDGGFGIDFVANNEKNFLLCCCEELFAVQIGSIADIFCCKVIYVGSNSEVETYSYKLIMENDNSTKSRERMLALNTTAEISGTWIRSVLDNPVVITGRIEICQEEFQELLSNGKSDQEEGETSELNYDMLWDIECSLCTDSMIAPIYQCFTGHSFCKNCKEIITECPTCKKKIRITQNTELAAFINNIPYPCKYEHCRFVGRPKDTKEHETTCRWGLFECPLSGYLGCQQRIVFPEIYDHVLNNHDEHILKTETVTVPWNGGEEKHDCYILCYRGKLFRLHFSCSEEKLKLAVQLVGPPEESDNYKFEIDFIDSTGDNNKVHFEWKCSPLTDYACAFENEGSFLGIYSLLIQNLVTTELSFMVKVIQT